MKDIWLLRTTYETDMEVLSPREGEDEHPVTVTHFIDLSSVKNPDVAIGIYGGHLGESAVASAKLIVRPDDFDIDFFNFGGCLFVSERMRQAMALDPSEVRYIDIDDSKSAPLARSKKYKMMEPLLMEDVLDPEKSVYWMDSIPPPSEFGPHEIYKLVLRSGIALTTDIFYDSFFATLILCTDELAMRILRAGCTGMELTDPRGYCQADVQRRRTMDGIEIYGEKTDPEEVRTIFRSKEKNDWIISRLKEV